MKRISLFIFFIFLMTSDLFAQDNRVWTKVDPTSINTPLEAKKNGIGNFETFNLNTKLLKEQLLPLSLKQAKKYSSQIILLPNVHGKLSQYRVKQTDLFHPELARKFELIKNYSGQSLDDGATTIHFTLGSLGFYGMILSPKATYIMEPYTKDKKTIQLFNKKDRLASVPYTCQSFENQIIAKTLPAIKNANDLRLRTFRLALATTEEYSNFHINAAGLGTGNNRADSINVIMSAIAITMSRVNPIFERDVALTMQLIPDNEQLIFLETDPGNDPYSNNNGSAMLAQNQTTIDNIIGSLNYDIGHVFSTGGGGVAFLNSPCGSSKAGGVTGLNSPVGDIFDIDLVAHEMGHQFGARHTFNGTTGSCGSNRNDNTAVEPGSGSTIMAYAGICAPQNIQSSSDAYFSSTSIQEIFANISAGASQCAQLTNFIDNLNVPIANAGLNYNIPSLTPFILRGQGSDADGNTLTYCWEQIDNEVDNIDIPPSSTQTEGAVFRSLSPSFDSIRYMPKLLTVLGGNIESTWEVVPSVSRHLDFELTVRDNVLGEGQTNSDQIRLHVKENAGPFKVSSQNVDGIVWQMGTIETITWNVAGTTTNDINAALVDILLSLDGGLTFTETLVSNTANDGSQEITVPNLISPNVRVMVKPSDNIFYAVNSTSFSIGDFITICSNYQADGLPLNIPDNSGVGVSSVIEVLEDFFVTDVNVQLDISHTWLWDLQIFLKAPNGTEVLIYDRSCGSAGQQRQDIDAVFDDAASSTICTLTIPSVSGLTKSDNLLSAFNGFSSLGNWTLKVVDNAQNDIGIINNWTLNLCQSKQTAAIDEFAFEDLRVSPNPFNNSTTVSFKSFDVEDVFISIFDIRGRLIKKKNYSNLAPYFREELNLEGLSSGVYILKIAKGNAFSSKKILKF